MNNLTSPSWLGTMIPGSKSLLSAAVLSVSLGLAGCGSDDNSGSGSANQAPEVSVTTSTLAEGSVSVGTVVATINATDLDDDELTLTISGGDTTYLTIEGDKIVLTAAGVEAINNDSLNLTSLTLEVTVSDGKDSITQPGTVGVSRSSGTNGNSIPTLTATTALSALEEESVTAGMVLANLSATDGDDDSLEYSLSGDHTAYAEVEDDEILLTAAGVTAVNDDSLNLTSISLTVTVSDSVDSTFQTLTYNILRVNEAPSVEVTAEELVEDFVEAGMLVATISATDPEGDDLTLGLTGTDSDLVELEGSSILLTAEGVEAINNDDQALTSLSLLASATDGSLSTDEPVTLTVTRKEDRYVKLFQDDFESSTLDKWTLQKLDGSEDWIVETYAGNLFAVGNCYQESLDCDYWMITPELDLTTFTDAMVQFQSAYDYGDSTAAEQVRLKVSTNFDGTNLDSADWQDISELATWTPGDFIFTDSGEVSLNDFRGIFIKQRDCQSNFFIS